MTDHPLKLDVLFDSAPNASELITSSARILQNVEEISYLEHEEKIEIFGLDERKISQATDLLIANCPNSIRFGNIEVIYQLEPVQAEPYVVLKVTFPESMMGAINADISSRRGIIMALKDYNGEKEIESEVPLAELIGYSVSLENITDGLGTFTLAFLGYKPMTNDSGPGPAAASMKVA